MLVPTRADAQCIIVLALNIGDSFLHGVWVGLTLDQGSHLILRDTTEHVAQELLQLALKTGDVIRVLHLSLNGRVFAGFRNTPGRDLLQRRRLWH